MIHHLGFMPPSRAQLAELRKLADDSFCVTSTLEFMKPCFPAVDGWVNAEDTATLLRLKNVEPHDDPWVSRGAEPKVRRSIFWLMEGGFTYSGEGVFFGCGRATRRIKPGEFVVFNDSTTHWVMSNKTWRGAAIQLRKAV